MRIPLLSAAVVGVLLLVGCTVSDPVVTPVPEPSSTPLFATDAAALQAATDAYAAYQVASDEIAAAGGINPERLKPLVTPAEFQRELSAIKDFANSHYSISGSSTFENAKLQQSADLGEGRAEVTIYVCSDVSATRLLDSNGTDITPANRVDRGSFEVAFVTPKDRHARLVLERDDPWSGSDIC